MVAIFFREPPTQAEYLRKRGCDIAQGYLFGRAVPP
jgi:EAL domain-containing protein (putative c-di-GMP-specific phosphodiesterase class I)